MNTLVRSLDVTVIFYSIFELFRLIFSIMHFYPRGTKSLWPSIF